MGVLDEVTPTEYLILDVMVARYRLGDEGWTFPTRFRAAMKLLCQRGYVHWKSGVTEHTILAWLTPEGARYLKLDQPYVLNGVQRGRVWEGES